MYGIRPNFRWIKTECHRISYPKNAEWNADEECMHQTSVNVDESRKIKHQLVATHRTVIMSALITGRRYKSRVLLHDGFVFHQNKHNPKTNTTYYKCSQSKVCGATGVQRGENGVFKLMDRRINRATLRLERGIITVAEFVSICALESAPDRSILVAWRRTAPPPRSQQIDSDSAWHKEH